MKKNDKKINTEFLDLYLKYLKDFSSEIFLKNLWFFI